MPNDFGDYLRARRTDPSLVPAATGARRRTPGLRREEVATAAGISVDYYTRLEQGRESNPGDGILESLVRVLRLTPDERDHLFRLRAANSPARLIRSADDDERARRLAALVDAVRPSPAYILDRLGNMLAVNAEGLALYEGIGDLPPERRNTCRYLLTDDRARETFVEWEQLARGAVAHLRAANADDLSDPDLQRLVAELSGASPLFAAWWGEHVVERRRASTTHVRGAGGEIVARRFEVLHLPEDAARMTLWLPALPG